jgi:hypothetical protein
MKPDYVYSGPDKLGRKEIPAKGGGGASREAVQNDPGNLSSTGLGSGRLHEAEKGNDKSPEGNASGGGAKFDRNAYQREYMRKRRAAIKVRTLAEEGLK